MKKLFALLLVAVMLISCCACSGGSSNDDVRGDVITGNKETTEAKATEPQETETQAATTEATVPQDTVPELSMGKAEGGSYTNDFLNLSCTLPEGWLFATEAELLEMSSIDGESYDEETYEQLKNATLIYDMSAQDQADGSNVIISLEKITTLQSIGLDLKEVIENQIDTVKASFEGMGCTDINVGYQKINLDGKDYDCMVTSVNLQGASVNQVMVTFVKGNYIAYVTVSAIGTDRTAEILEYFNFA